MCLNDKKKKSQGDGGPRATSEEVKIWVAEWINGLVFSQKSWKILPKLQSNCFSDGVMDGKLTRLGDQITLETEYN